MKAVDKLDLIKIKNFSSPKDKVKSMRRQATDWEKYLWKTHLIKTVTQNIPRTLNRQKKKKTSISIKNRSMTLTHTTPKIYRGQINIMERYSTSCRQRNANQNNDYHNISIRMAKIQNTTTSNVDMDMEQLKLIHCWGATRKVQPTLEQFGSVSRN